MKDKSQLLNINRLILIFIVIISAVVFIIDTHIPLGVSGGVVYVLLVMATYRVEGKNITRGAGILGTLLIIAGFVFSVSSEYIVLSAINHLVTVIVVWAGVWFVNNYKLSIKRLLKNYRVLFQSANDEILVFQLDENNRPLPFLEVNDTACDMLGYSHEELLQKSIYDIAAINPEKTEELIEEALANKKIVREGQHATKDGEIIPVELSIRSFTYRGRPALITVGRDLRERLHLEREILDASEQERQRIGRDLHDDVGQLLSAAKMTIQMLEREMSSKGIPEAEKVQEITDMITTISERTRTLSHGLVPENIESEGLHGALQGWSAMFRACMMWIYSIAARKGLF